MTQTFRCVLLLSAILAACARGPSETPRQTGAAAPNFTLPSASGGTVTLAAFREKKRVLLYFSMGPG
jgi:hypothetical protein